MVSHSVNGRVSLTLLQTKGFGRITYRTKGEYIISPLILSIGIYIQKHLKTDDNGDFRSTSRGEGFKLKVKSVLLLMAFKEDYCSLG